MKYQLETIPIWDAYKEDTECPICFLAERAEKLYLDYFLGNSVMVPEMRVEVNKTGFCKDHFSKLLESGKNRHGLGLLSHTHLQKQISEIHKISRKINSKTGDKAIKKFAGEYKKLIRDQKESCVVCSRIDAVLDRYAYTIIYLWKREVEFKKTFHNSKGFCLHHLQLILKIAEEVLYSKEFSVFIKETADIQDKALNRLESEILWYTQKFDYQNESKPWGNSKNALHRTIQKLSGKVQEIING